MENTQLQDYVKAQRSAGVPDSQILPALQQAGWPATDIAAAMAMAPAPRPPSGIGTGSAPMPNSVAGIKMPAMNAKITTLMTQCVLFSVIGTAITDGGRFISQFFLGGYAGGLQQYSNALYQAYGSYAPTVNRYWLISPTQVFTNLVFAAISGAILGYVLGAFWVPVRAGLIKYSGGKLDTAFKMLFYPSLFIVLGGIFSTLLLGFIPAVIGVVSSVAGRYVFAKGVSKALGE